MPENNCAAKDCPMLPRIEALERAYTQRSSTHREIFERLGKLERITDVQENKLDTILTKLDELAEKVDALESRPAKRWDKTVDTILVAIVTGIVCFLLGRMGL